MVYPQIARNAGLFGWGSRLIAFFVVVGSLSVWSTSVHAQINPFRGYRGPTLSKEDLASGRAAAGKLLNEDQAQVGKSEDWAGPTSGNTGSISVQKAFRRRGMECRGLRTEIRYKRALTSSPKVLNLDVCRIKTGEWKLV